MAGEMRQMSNIGNNGIKIRKVICRQQRSGGWRKKHDSVKAA